MSRMILAPVVLPSGGMMCPRSNAAANPRGAGEDAATLHVNFTAEVDTPMDRKTKSTKNRLRAKFRPFIALPWPSDNHNSSNTAAANTINKGDSNTPEQQATEFSFGRTDVLTSTYARCGCIFSDDEDAGPDADAGGAGTDKNSHQTKHAESRSGKKAQLNLCGHCREAEGWAARYLSRQMIRLVPILSPSSDSTSSSGIDDFNKSADNITTAPSAMRFEVHLKGENTPKCLLLDNDQVRLDDTAAPNEWSACRNQRLRLGSTITIRHPDSSGGLKERQEGRSGMILNFALASYDDASPPANCSVASSQPIEATNNASNGKLIGPSIVKKHIESSAPEGKSGNVRYPHALEPEQARGLWEGKKVYPLVSSERMELGAADGGNGNTRNPIDSGPTGTSSFGNTRKDERTAEECVSTKSSDILTQPESESADKIGLNGSCSVSDHVMVAKTKVPSQAEELSGVPLTLTVATPFNNDSQVSDLHAPELASMNALCVRDLDVSENRDGTTSNVDDALDIEPFHNDTVSPNKSPPRRRVLSENVTTPSYRPSASPAKTHESTSSTATKEVPSSVPPIYSDNIGGLETPMKLTLTEETRTPMSQPLLTPAKSFKPTSSSNSTTKDLPSSLLSDLPDNNSGNHQSPVSKVEAQTNRDAEASSGDNSKQPEEASLASRSLNSSVVPRRDADHPSSQAQSSQRSVLDLCSPGSSAAPGKTPKCVVYLLPLGRAMPQGRLKILKQKLAELGDDKVTITGGFTSAVTHVVLDPNVEAVAVASTLGFLSAETMRVHFLDKKIHAVTPDWCTNANFHLAPELEMLWGGFRRLDSAKNHQKKPLVKKRRSVAPTGDQGWIKKARSIDEFAPVNVVKASSLNEDSSVGRMIRRRKMDNGDNCNSSLSSHSEGSLGGITKAMRGGTAHENVSADTETQKPLKRNAGLAAMFNELSELQKECPLLPTDEWRTNTYALVSGRLRHLDFEVTNSTNVLSRLSEIRGFGPGVMEKIRQYFVTGTCEKLHELRTEPTRVAVRKVGCIWGVGPKTASRLVKQGYRNIADVRRGLASGDIYLSENACVGVDCYEDLLERMERSEVKTIGEIVAAAVYRIFPEAEICTAGSFRRGKATSGDCDVLIVHPGFATTTPRGSLARILGLLENEGHIAHHLTEVKDAGKYFEDDSDVSSFFDESPDKSQRGPVPPKKSNIASSRQSHDDCKSSVSWMGVFRSPVHKGKRRRVDIKFYPYENKAFAKLYFTGSGTFNRSMRIWATKSCNMTLTDKGLFKLGVTNHHEYYRMDRNGKRCARTESIHCKTEREIFDALNLEYRAPSERICFDSVVEKGKSKPISLDDIGEKDIAEDAKNNRWID